MSLQYKSSLDVDGEVRKKGITLKKEVILVVGMTLENKADVAVSELVG